MQNLVVGSHTVYVHVGGPKNLGTLEPSPLKWAAWPTPETCTCVIMPNFVALGQTVWA